MTERERFCAVLANGPILESDAVVVLCGEDCQPRVQVAAGLMARNAAPKVILTGGVDDDTRMGATTALGLLAGEFGLSPSKIQVDDGPQNTWEQAVSMVELAKAEEWNRMLLIASAYHMPRAFLTFLRALKQAGIEDKVRMMAVPASQAPWFEKPDGKQVPRISLLDEEFDKCDAYLEHVATWTEGLEYLAAWEAGKRDAA